MADLSEWVLLAYRLPREPSTPRITLWRKLRKLGAVQLVDGLVALPANANTREQFDWLADEVIDADGEAWTWTAMPGSKAQQTQLAARMTETAAVDYRAVIEEAERLVADGASSRRTLGRLRRELHRIEARDHYPPAEREQARRALGQLAEVLEAADEESVS
jgi:hypothetical protein